MIFLIIAKIVFLKFGFYGSNLVIFTQKVAKHLPKIKIREAY